MSTLPAPRPGGFCEQAWDVTSALREAIVDHPFNLALTEGTLDRERFAFYIVQDGRYLIGFAQALAAASARASDPEDAAVLAGSAHGALVEERRLHAGYVEEFGLTESDVDGVATSPSCLAYTSFLRASALTDPYPVLLASVLPCFWVYQHVGSTILNRCANRFGGPSDQKDSRPATDHFADHLAGHPYRRWIETYADDEFADAVLAARDLTDKAAAATTPEMRQRMTDAFVRSTEYEWMFWNSAWTLEQWPTVEWVRAAQLP